jgi:hypothetical protein
MFPTAATTTAVDKIFRAHIGHVPIRKRIFDAPAKGTFYQMGGMKQLIMTGAALENLKTALGDPTGMWKGSTAGRQSDVNQTTGPECMHCRSHRNREFDPYSMELLSHFEDCNSGS